MNKYELQRRLRILVTDLKGNIDPKYYWYLQTNMTDFKD